MIYNSCGLVIVLLIAPSYCLTDYYWKDYTGKVPEDAFPAGHDVNNETTYAGLVYLKNKGIIPTTIYPNQKVFAAAGEVEESQNYIKILCTENPKNLNWLAVNKTDFHFITMYKQLVRGGVQDTNWLHIGRINYQGQLIIGKILSGRAPINDAIMEYVHNDDMKTAYSYEVLTFEDPKNEEVEILR